MEIKLATHSDELYQILAIQKENHYQNLADNSKNDKGFVTVMHSFEMLDKMNSKAPQIIAKKNNKVIAYALVMLCEFKNLIPALIPMFETIEKLEFKEEKLNEFNYYLMGQICVADDYKRRGLFTKLYLKHKEVYSPLFDYCITEVSTSNTPSTLAHKKVGFQRIHTYNDATNEWHILLWDWK